MFYAAVSRGAKAGLAAGLLFGLLVALVGNPLVGAAEHELGGGHEAGHDHGGHEDSLVSAAVTDAVSVGGGVLWGLLLGIAFGVAYFLFEPAIPGPEAVRSHVLAAAGFVTVSGAPWLALPPSAPGVSHALSVESRMLWYGAMVVAGAMACAFAVTAFRRLSGRGAAAAVLGAAVPSVGLLAVAALAPGDLAVAQSTGRLGAAVQGFAVVGQLLLWGTLAAVHSRLDGPDAASADLEGQYVAAD